MFCFILKRVAKQATFFGFLHGVLFFYKDLFFRIGRVQKEGKKQLASSLLLLLPGEDGEVFYVARRNGNLHFSRTFGTSLMKYCLKGQIVKEVNCSAAAEIQLRLQRM